MSRKLSERLRGLLVAVLVTVGVWAVSCPAPALKDPFEQHDPATCITCMTRKPGTVAERQHIIDQVELRRKAARIKAAAGH